MRIRRIRPTEWRQLRELRLRALAEAPYAFGWTLQEASAVPEGQWKHWAAPSSESALFAWEQEAGVLGGMAVGEWHPGEEMVEISGMWVAPEGRRQGVGKALLEAVTTWGHTQGAQRADLEVTESNEAAVRFYEKVGFVATGATRPLPSDPSQTAIAMTRPLR